MKLTLLALTYFQKTAELQHLTHAAEALHISQPSLSHTIKMLEQELGVPLFRRSGRNIVLTKYGEILLSHTNRIMSELKHAQKELEDAKEAQDMTVTISIFAASMIIPAFLTEFKKEHPHIRFEIIQQRDRQEINHHSRVDLYLSSSINPIDTDHSITLLKEDILLAMPDTNPLASHASVNLADFEKADFITLQQGVALRNITDFYCRAAGFTPHVILESDNPGTVIYQSGSWRLLCTENHLVRRRRRPCSTCSYRYTRLPAVHQPVMGRKHTPYSAGRRTEKLFH